MESQRMFSLHESQALWTQNWHGRKNLSWFYLWNSKRSLSKQMPVQWELQNPWGRFKQAFGACAPVLTWVSLEQRFNSTAQHNTAMQRTASGVRGRSDSTKDAKQTGTDLFSVWYETWYQTENKQTQRKKSGIETQHLTDRVLPGWTSRVKGDASRRDGAPVGGSAPGEARGLQGQDKPGSEGLQESWEIN